LCIHSRTLPDSTILYERISVAARAFGLGDSAVSDEIVSMLSKSLEVKHIYSLQ
jgi:hypothetical protein